MTVKDKRDEWYSVAMAGRLRAAQGTETLLVGETILITSEGGAPLVADAMGRNLPVMLA